MKIFQFKIKLNLGMMKTCRASDYIRMALYVVEEGADLCTEAAKKSGKPYEQMVFIMDLLNMTANHYSYKPFANSYLTVSEACNKILLR